MRTIMFSNSLAEKCPDILKLWDYDKNGIKYFIDENYIRCKVHN